MKPVKSPRKRTRRRHYDDEMPDAMPEERDIPEGPGEDK